jgi:hypothetical protein
VFARRTLQKSKTLWIFSDAAESAALFDGVSELNAVKTVGHQDGQCCCISVQNSRLLSVELGDGG